eukprot:CAMPEP_0170066298 /NCGR_PEP_ID=MMETSP0019_2-20121128/6050_1 /TAXON_ID=98059 /ORGANISM="Dinobryon sp., Strain UTEXLB2267" /LENGTH=403 /DNA_ID=CAMNT_0010273357 /DNA_START=407 /DNA_END=1615 /DNA_ORIENTATION=+
MESLHVVHRLDRVTSGLVILAKSKDAAAEISKNIRDKKMKKVYLARVKGCFGSNLSHLKALDSINFRSFDTEDSEMDLQQKKRKDTDIFHDRERHEDFNGIVHNPINKQLEGNKEELKKLSKKAKRAISKSFGKKQDGFFTSLSSSPVNGSSGNHANDNTNQADINTHTLSEANNVEVTPVDIGYMLGGLELSDGVHQASILRESDDVVSVDEMESTGCWVQCPIKAISHRDGIYGSDPMQGRPSLSHFRRLWYCRRTDTSLVECCPYTGRTHQLRLHLQLCGYPIANDPFYGGDLYFLRPHLLIEARKAFQLMRSHNITPLSKLPVLDCFNCLEEGGEGNKNEEVVQKDENGQTWVEGDSEETNLIRNCKYCREAKIRDELESVLQCDEIWLHSLSYAGSDW